MLCRNHLGFGLGLAFMNALDVMLGDPEEEEDEQQGHEEIGLKSVGVGGLQSEAGDSMVGKAATGKITMRQMSFKRRWVGELDAVEVIKEKNILPMKLIGAVVADSFVDARWPLLLGVARSWHLHVCGLHEMFFC